MLLKLLLTIYLITSRRKTTKFTTQWFDDRPYWKGIMNCYHNTDELLESYDKLLKNKNNIWKKVLNVKQSTLGESEIQLFELESNDEDPKDKN